MISRIDWDNVDWTAPMQRIAELVGCSRQRVSQVAKRLGIKRRTPTKEERILRLKTELYTIEQLAVKLDCSQKQVSEMLNKACKECRVLSRYVIADAELFKQWLVDFRKYPGRVAGNIVSRCGKVERAYSMNLKMTLKSEINYNRLLDDMSSRPEKLLRQGSKRISLAAYRFSIKCYHEFYSINRD